MSTATAEPKVLMDNFRMEPVKAQPPDPKDLPGYVMPPVVLGQPIYWYSDHGADPRPAYVLTVNQEVLEVAVIARDMQEGKMCVRHLSDPVFQRNPAAIAKNGYGAWDYAPAPVYSDSHVAKLEQRIAALELELATRPDKGKK
jgi:hypothetical protein